MTIEHPINSFLYLLFPDVKEGDMDALKGRIEKYYTVGPYKPKVTVMDGQVKVDIEDKLIQSHSPQYKKVLDLCDKRQFSEAAVILRTLIAENPTVSEYHRVMGQIASEEGDQEAAIHHLIDALRWDSHNGWALLMMGNIFAKYKNDIDTAITYYDQAIIANTEDYISLTNVAYLATQSKRWEKAREYLQKVFELKRDYPNALMVQAMIYEGEGDDKEAFEYYVKTMKSCLEPDQVWTGAFSKAYQVADRIVEAGIGVDITEPYRKKLEYLGGKKIVIECHDDIQTPAKMEFAENHRRDYHVVKYKEGYPAVEHLIMHEMAHLQLMLEAREEGENKLFTSNEGHRKKFKSRVKEMGKELSKKGFGDDAIEQFMDQIFEGQNTLMYNVPIDLFIEDMLYKEFKALRPYQFLSLYQLTHEGINAVTDQRLIQIVPWTIINHTKILNMVGAMQYRDLYGVDLLDKFYPTSYDTKQAKKFYEEFQEYRKDKEPGEEYEIIQNWGEDLGIDRYFELVDEEAFRSAKTPESVMEAIERDAFGLEDHDPEKEREMAKFLKAQEELGLNTAVVMYMVQALQYLRALPSEKVRDIAVEIAMQGIHGYKTDGTEYKLAHVPKKSFSGYQILAWYYVSWSLAMPDKVASLQLPFDKEFEVALMME